MRLVPRKNAAVDSQRAWMRFVKMHGLGNDFVLHDGFANSLPGEPSSIARQITDRHTGVGADGLLLVGPSHRADFALSIFNADGSDGGICGNGLRCAVKFLFEAGTLRRTAGLAATGAGSVEFELRTLDGRVSLVEVRHPTPILEPAGIPALLPARVPVVDYPLELDGLPAPDGVASRTLLVTCVSIGNPHCVLFVDDVNEVDVPRLGPLIERHPAFPLRTNTQFVAKRGERDLDVRSWERGCGETRACATGAAASVVAHVLRGGAAATYTVHLPGGALTVTWAGDGPVAVAGPAVEVFRGTWPVPTPEGVKAAPCFR